MPLPVYATRRDVRDLGGVPRGLLTNEGHLVAGARASNDVIELNEHGFEDDDEVLVRAADGGSLPTPLVEGTTYYAKRLSPSTFKLAATAGGVAIDLTSDGIEMMVIAALPVDRLIRFYSRWVDDVLPAHLVPLTADPGDGTYPDVIVGVVARLVGKALLNHDGKSSALVNEAELAAKAQVERWAAGKPVRDPRITASANLAVVASSGTDPRGWGSGKIP